MQDTQEHWFLHADLDAFFASVEQLDHPEYRGKPLIVGGKPEDKRSVVSTCSYEARKFGVHSAMPTFKAYQLCPQGIFVHGRMERYAELSRQIMGIFRDFSPDVDQMSIDEACIDLTGTRQLFGPPQEVALKIKNLVKEKTGLTISLGLAPTKYLAKLASEVNKPDGFFMISPGEEQNFMLNLPLKKVWGVGNKTLEQLQKSGIRTTRDIYEKPMDVLQFMYGKNMGSFLYNVVRGIETGSFDRKTESHSISSETTFVEDLTDSYIIETKILELCHGLIFRLINENSYSRTVMIKIRYEDFSTVSIRRTVDYNILTLDTFYALAKELFNEKYNKKSGVRLIGVGLENLQTSPLPHQEDLFDDGSKRKDTVEKAILKLEKKHPEIKVHKARLLQNLGQKVKLLFLIFLLSVFAFSNAALSAEKPAVDSKGAAALLPQTLDTSSEPSEETPSEPDNPSEEKTDETETSESGNKTSESKNEFSIFNWELPDSVLKYQLSGYWSGELTGTIDSSFGNDSDFTLSTGTPVFKQEVDLSADIQVTDKWYFNLEFADTFSKNTYTLGYKNDSFLNTFFFSNRNVTFPEYSSSLTGYSLSGGENQAPGFYFHFNDIDLQKWTGDLMVRYDMTTFKDAVFYGKNSASDFNLDLSSFVYGKIFVLPSKEALLDIDSIYVESARGTYTDQNGYKYKKLDATEYQVISSKNLLILSTSAGSQKKNDAVPSVLVTFKTDTTSETFIASLGSYSEPETYLGKIQSCFTGGNYKNINLEKYTSSFAVTIEGSNGVVLQASQGFSPFLYAGLYDLGIISNADAKVVYSSSEQSLSDYYADTASSSFDLSNENYFYENHLYAEVGKESVKDEDYTNPYQRYPFADTNPFVYLSSTPSSDITLLVTSYSKVSNYDIGKKASKGSVKVYINGILDSGADYEATSGFVNLSKSVSDADKIYITWQEENDDAQNGSLSVAAGYKYTFLPDLTGDLSFTASWPLSPYATYAASSVSLSGFAAVTGGIDYKIQNLKVKDALSLSLSNKNVSGLYFTRDPEDTVSQTYYLSSSNIYETKTLPVLNFDSAPVLEKADNGTVLPVSAKADSEITGYKIPLTWDFSDLDSDKNNWASVDVKLSAGDQLCNSSEIELALKPETSLENIDIYLQLGIKAEKTFSGENSTFISTWKLTGTEDTKVLSKLDLSDTSWQIIKIQISDSDRAKLVSENDMRVIAVQTSTSSSLTGAVSLGPYEPVITGNFAFADESVVLSSILISTEDSPSSKKALKNQTTSGSKITWYATDAALSETDNFITTASYFEPSDISAYGKINLDFQLNAESSVSSLYSDEYGFILLLDSDAPSLTEDGKPALELKLSSDIIQNLISENKSWNVLTVNTKTKVVSINGNSIPSSDYSLKITPLILPSREKISLNTSLNGSLYDSGTFVLGNLYYTDTEPDFNLKNYTSADFEKEDLWAFKNIKINLSSVQSSSVSQNSTSPDFQIYGTADESFSVSALDFSSNLLFSKSDWSSSANPVSEASHSIKTNRSIFGLIDFTEKFTSNVSENEMEKSNSLNLNLTKLSIPLSLYFNSSVKNNSVYLNQSESGGFKLSVPVKNFKINLDSEINLSQKADSDKISLLDDTENYFTAYKNAFLLEFSPGLQNSDNRSETLTGTFSVSMPFFNLTPTFKVNISSLYKDSSSKTFTDTESFVMNLPFKISGNTFNINFSRTGKNQSEAYSLTSYQTDLEKLFTSQQQRSWFYNAIPFADLFMSDLSEKITSENASYTSKYELVWKRNMTNSVLDFYLPLGASFCFSRDITKTDTVSDYYQVKLSASNAFVNMLGKSGKLNLFKFFDQDEFSSNLTSVIKIPVNHIENTTFTVSLYNSILFYITSSSTVKAGSDVSISTDLDWKVRATGIWTHGGTDSFILRLPEALFKNLDLKNTAVTRKESLNITFSDNDSILSQTYELDHSCSMKINRNCTITAGIGINLQLKENASTVLSTEYSLGGSVKF